jgi:hypothetical protein
VEGSSVPIQALTQLRFAGVPGQRHIPDGSIFTVRVTKRSGPWVHLVGPSLRLVARNGANLSPGDLVSVQAKRTEGRLVLEILRKPPADPRALTQDPFTEILTHLNRGDTPAVRAVLSAILLSRRLVSKELVRRSIQNMRGLSSGRTGLAVHGRAAVEWADRELPLHLLKKEQLRDLLYWYGGTHPEDSSATSDKENRREREGRDSPESPRRNEAASLKEYCSRRVSRIVHPLQVYNHILPSSGETHWVVIPLGVTAPDPARTSGKGVLKVAFDIRRQIPLRALLSVSPPDSFRLEKDIPGDCKDEPPLWWFYWTLQGEVRLRKAGYQGKVMPPPESLLATLGVTGHTERVVDGDGFSVLQETTDFKRIEQYG